MELTEQQRQLLQGKGEPLLTRYLRWLVEWGDALGASRMVPVSSVHALIRTPLIKSLSLETMRSYISELREICSCKVKCLTTTHNRGINLEHYRPEMGLRKEEVDFSRELPVLAGKAGILATWTCTPYLVGNVPVFGEICAWTESSAVVYANSILGARTTRHGRASSIGAALLGFVPEFGVLLDKNRKGDFVVDVQVRLESASDWGALGFYVGKIAKSRIPVFQEIEHISLEEAKQLSASLPYSGEEVTMFHIVGITPEAPSLEQALQGESPQERISFTEKELEEAYQEMRTIEASERIDTVVLGCPFCSLDEIREVATALQDRTVAHGVEFWVCTSYGTFADAKRMGYADRIQEAGGRLLYDYCLAGGSILFLPKTVATNSFKQAHYCQNMLKAKVFVTNTEECIDLAVKGRLS